MSFTAETITASVGSVGKPATAEVGTDDKTNFCRQALDYLNERIQDIRIYTDQFVADQQAYTISTDIKTILYVWQQAPSTTILSNALSAVGLGGTDFIQVFSSVGLSGWDEYTSYIQAKQQLLAWRIVDSSTWKFLNHTLYLLPTPTSSGEYFAYLATKQWTYSTMPDEWQSILEDLYCWKQMTWLATMRLNEAGVTQSGQTIDYPADKCERIARKYKEAADERLKKLECKQRLML